MSEGHWCSDSDIALVQSCQPHASGISKIAADRRHCRLVVTGGNDGGLCLLESGALTKPPLAVVPSANAGGGGHLGRIEALAWLPEDDLMFVTGGDNRLKIWDASAASECVMSVDLLSKVHGVSNTLGPPTSAAVALDDNTVRLVDLRLGRAVCSMQGHSAAALCVLWGPPGTFRLYSGGVDGTLRAWDSRMGARSLFLFDPYAHEPQKPLKTWSKEDEEKSKSSFGRLPDNKLTLHQRIEPYRPMSIKGALSTNKARGGHPGLTFGSAPPRVTVSEDAPRRVSSLESSTQLLGSTRAAESVRHMLEPPRRQYVHDASVAHRGAVIAISFPTRKTKTTFGKLFSCGVDGRLRVWDPHTGVLISKSHSSFEVRCWMKEISLQIDTLSSPDDVCFVPEKEHVSVRCTRTGDLLCGLAAHTQEVNCVEALAGGGEVLSGGNDGRLLRWRANPKGRGGPVLPTKKSKDFDDDVICLD